VAGISSTMYGQLREALLDSGLFANDRQLGAIFAHPDLSPWRHRIPQAPDPASRVNETIAFLLEKHRADTQENALVLLLRVLSGQLDPADECHRRLIRLAEELERTLRRESSHISDPTIAAHPDELSSDVPPVDFIIGSALEEERDAVLDRLPGCKRVMPFPDEVHIYFSLSLSTTFPDGSTCAYRVIVLPPLGMGRVQAAMTTTDAIRRWHPRYVILIGIAGGVAAKGVNLGDVLVADQIVDYELQKLTPEGTDIRWRVYQADARLVGVARDFRDKRWQESIATKRPEDGQPRRHIGPIASGDKVIAFGNALSRYRKMWSKLIGVEMEAGGVAAATFQAAERPGFLMVRGVSDLADEKKGSPQVEKWRAYACEVAASYAIALLKSGPVLPWQSGPPASHPVAAASKFQKNVHQPKANKPLFMASLHIDPDNPPIATIRELLLAAFTSKDLRRFCQDRPAFRPIVARFGSGHGLDDMVDRVIDYSRTQFLWDDLLAEVAQLNPRQYARFKSRLSGSNVDSPSSPA